jgi:hypothetical protein
VSDPVAFLQAELDEDEAAQRIPAEDEVALAAPGEVPGPWHTEYCGWRLGEALSSECECGVRARVLAEVAAKRRILALVAPPDPHEVGDGCPDCAVVYAMLQPYAGRPGFDPAWTLEAAQ